MRKLVCLSMVIAFMIVGCTKNNYIDTGISDGRHEGKSLLEYMEAHPYDWDSTVLMVRHSGEDMIRLFEGQDSDHEEITFFGLTNHSIRRYLLENGLKRVTDLDADWCHSILLKHVVDGKVYRKDIPVGKQGDFGTVGMGGITLTTLAGTSLWVYVDIEETSYVEEAGAKHIFVNFMEANRVFGVASGDIEPDNCVVHALDYNFTLGDEE